MQRQTHLSILQQQAVRCRVVPVLTCNFLPEFCSNRLEISLNKFMSQTITQITQSHKKVMSARFISRFRHFHLKLRHFPTETGTMPSVITTFCYTNWACRHVANHLKLICIRLLARNFCSRNADTPWKSNPVFRHGPITDCAGGQTAACHWLTLRDEASLDPDFHLSLNISCPPDSSQAQYLPFTSSILSLMSLYSPLFFSLPVICDSPLQGAEASLLSVPTEVSSIIILKAF